jgi:hypothetical protein
MGQRLTAHAHPLPLAAHVASAVGIGQCIDNRDEHVMSKLRKGCMILRKACTNGMLLEPQPCSRLLGIVTDSLIAQCSTFQVAGTVNLGDQLRIFTKLRLWVKRSKPCRR